MAYLEKHANTVNFFLKSDRPSTMKSSNVCWFESARQISESEYHLLWVVPDFLAATEEVKFSQGVKTRNRARETYHPIQQWMPIITFCISGAAQRKSTTSNLQSDVGTDMMNRLRSEQMMLEVVFVDYVLRVVQSAAVYDFLLVLVKFVVEKK